MYVLGRTLQLPCVPLVPLLAIYSEQEVSGQFTLIWEITMPKALVVGIVLMNSLLIHVIFVPFILIPT